MTYFAFSIPTLKYLQVFLAATINRDLSVPKSHGGVFLVEQDTLGYCFLDYSKLIIIFQEVSFTFILCNFIVQTLQYLKSNPGNPFRATVELGDNFLVTLKFSLTPKVPYPWHLVTGNGSLSPSSTVPGKHLPICPIWPNFEVNGLDW